MNFDVNFSSSMGMNLFGGWLYKNNDRAEFNVQTTAFYPGYLNRSTFFDVPDKEKTRLHSYVFGVSGLFEQLQNGIKTGNFVSGSKDSERTTTVLEV